MHKNAYCASGVLVAEHKVFVLLSFLNLVFLSEMWGLKHNFYTNSAFM